MMSTEIAKERLNNELIRIYSNAGFDKESISTLIKEANDYATAKKDGNLKLKLAEKLEKAHNLTPTQQSTPQQQYNSQFNFHEYRENGQKTEQSDQIESDNTPVNEQDKSLEDTVDSDNKTDGKQKEPKQSKNED